MKIQLFFITPAYISCKGYKNEDSIQVLALKNFYFITSNSSLPIARDSKIVAILPQQLTNDKIANDNIVLVTQSVKVGTVAATTVTVFSNFLLSAALTQLWGMVNAL
jgi:hypothetical protein